jgi:hypothetical protein
MSQIDSVQAGEATMQKELLVERAYSFMALFWMHASLAFDLGSSQSRRALR